MITTRERLRPSEVLALWSGRTPSLDALVRRVVPAEGRHLSFMSQGKAVFEQIVVSAGLAGARVIVPAFFPDDFVGVFAKYRMTPVFVDVDAVTRLRSTASTSAGVRTGPSAIRPSITTKPPQRPHFAMCPPLVAPVYLPACLPAYTRPGTTSSCVSPQGAFAFDVATHSTG